MKTKQIRLKFPITEYDALDKARQPHESLANCVKRFIWVGYKIEQASKRKKPIEQYANALMETFNEVEGT